MIVTSYVYITEPTVLTGCCLCVRALAHTAIYSKYYCRLLSTEASNSSLFSDSANN